MKKTVFFSLIVVIIGVAIYSYSRSTFSKNQADTPTDSVKKVNISTSYGDIKIMLYSKTPQHSNNFYKLAKEGYYDGTLFHRVIKGFMIQGGDPDSKNATATASLGMGGPNYTIPAEFMPQLYFHKKGALAAARTSNPTKASSGSQFYIVQGKVYTEQELAGMANQTKKSFTKEQIKAYTTVGGTPFLDGEYTVYGEVYEGLDVLDKIAAVETGASDRPKTDVKMTVKIIE